MKEFYLLLLFIVGAAASIPEYHGDRRFWTVVDSDNRTNVALHILNKPVNLIFPKNKTIAQLLSDIKLFSPSGNVQCQDTTNTMGFTLLFDEQNHIRGEIKMALTGVGQKVKMFLYDKCGVTEIPDDYATRIIEGIEEKLEDIYGRSCFKDGEPPFRQHGTNTADNVMELKVSPGTPGAFGCQAFLILPEYMRVEDGPLPKAQVNPINNTFAEKATPIFLRIGNNTVIPAFKFAFPLSCNSFKTELYLNFKDELGCKIGIEITQTGFKFSTKGDSAKEIKDASKSPTLVFHETKDLVYVKVKHPLFVHAFDTCTMAKSASDQLVVQLAPEEGGQCDSADVTLSQKDVEKNIDVLIDRAKIVEPNITITPNGTENVTIAAVVTTPKSSDAGFSIWWIALALFGILILVAAVVITYACILQRIRNPKQKPKGPPRSILNHDKEGQPKSLDVKTAVPAESPKKKNKKKKKKKDGELDESSKVSKKSKKEKPQPPKSKPSEREKVDLYEPLPPPMIQKQPRKPGFSAVRTDRTQTEPTGDPTIETGTTQVDSQRTVSGTIEKAKPRPKLKTHANNFTNENELQVGDNPTLQTQVTQPSS
uniref:Peptidase S72 domain-containing protein n=1 Tax=Panagrolaimus davidi TaxID=227884 RepID=A0A914QCQ0_9BILA